MPTFVNGPIHLAPLEGALLVVQNNLSLTTSVHHQAEDPLCVAQCATLCVHIHKLRESRDMSVLVRAASLHCVLAEWYSVMCKNTNCRRLHDFRHDVVKQTLNERDCANQQRVSER